MRRFALFSTFGAVLVVLGLGISLFPSGSQGVTDAPIVQLEVQPDQADYPALGCWIVGLDNVNRQPLAALASTSNAAPVQHYGSLQVTLEGLDGQRVEGRVILVKGREVVQRGTVEAVNGVAVFTELVPSEYTVLVAVESLPDGSFPGLAVGRNQAGRGGMSVEVKADETAVVVFPIESGAWVFGQVSGVPADFLASVWVHFQDGTAGRNTEQLRNSSFKVDESGRYQGWVFPGTLTARAAPDRSQDEKDWHPLVKSVHALPTIWELSANNSYEINFDLSPGVGELYVTVLDQNGQAMPNRAVYLYPTQLRVGNNGDSLPSAGLASTMAKLMTDLRGQAYLAGLEPASYALWVEPLGCNPLAQPGINKLGQPTQPQTIELKSGANQVQLTVMRPHPVRVQGRLTSASGKPLLRVLLFKKAGTRERDFSTDITTAPDGSFDFYVDAAEENLLMEMIYGGETKTVPLVLSPVDEQIWLPLDF